MENQVEKKETLNVKGLILLIGAVFGAIITIAASGSLAKIILGALIGFAIAVFFNYVILPFKPHDR